MADRHAIIKNGCKEIAYGLGKAITFMAKWDYGMAGSSCHVHQSLWSADGKSPLFFDKAGDHGMSETMKHYLAGQLEHAGEITYFLAPYINSYKRFMAGTFAPTRAVWSFDNRTAGYRVCGDGTKPSASNAGSAAPISTLIWPSRRCSPPASTASRRR